MKMQEFEAFSAGHWVLKMMQKIMPNVVKSQYIQDCDAIQMLLYPALVISETIFLPPPFNHLILTKGQIVSFSQHDFYYLALSYSGNLSPHSPPCNYL